MIAALIRWSLANRFLVVLATLLVIGVLAGGLPFAGGKNE